MTPATHSTEKANKLQYSIYALTAASMLVFSPFAKAVDASACTSEATANNIRQAMSRNGREVLEVADAQVNPFAQIIISARKKETKNGVAIRDNFAKSVEGQCSALVLTNNGEVNIVYDFIIRNSKTYTTIHVLTSDHKSNGEWLSQFIGEKPRG